MTWWDQASAECIGSLLAGAILLPLALWIEAVLDEWRDRRHEKKQTTRKRS